MHGIPDGFDPVVAEWFASAHAAPTPVQTAAWPRILAGEHLLITAPTGSGKTLAAFLAALNAFATGAYPVGRTSVLYVSPLKALNNDIRRNLLTPLAGLKGCAASRGTAFPQIAVASRSGDTPAAERRRMLRRPPEILITTPESLNLLLSSPRARTTLATVRTVILDEIHAVVGSKRGTHLMTAVERVAMLAGEFQRIAVSATVRPLEVVARFVGGRRLDERDREVGIVQAPDTKRIELTVDVPERPESVDPGTPDGIWPGVEHELRRVIERNESTLIFVTTRRHAEKLTLMLNEGHDEPIAYAHHGSLSRELRSFVERALKEGRLRAIVATNTLELGIDIGALDEVVLVKTPMTVSSTLQRVGRAGHRVGETSRGTLLPLHGRDVVDATAMAGAALERDIEEVRPVEGPLDVLAQVIVSMTAMEAWNVDALYAAIMTAYPYRDLERRRFDQVVEMLAGRYAETRVRELRPRINYDRVSGEIRARDGATTLLYSSGGTIPDRGYFSMRAAGGGQVGELDEEFVWERRPGETFAFGSQSWTIQSITDRDVVVVPAAPGARAIPFWRADARGREVHYAARLLEFLERCEHEVSAGTLAAFLERVPYLTVRARTALEGVLERQRTATGTALPHRHHVVVECVHNAPRARADQAVREVIIHTGWGGRVNEPLAIVLAEQWSADYGTPLAIHADNDCLAALLPREIDPCDAFSPTQCRRLLRRGAIERELRAGLESSGRFGALFRENAGRALLLPSSGFGRRMPLWLTRLRSKRLLASTARFEDFPILIETWRACLSDEFDLPALRRFLEEIASGEVAVSVCETAVPSPFASEVMWRQVNSLMYEDDTAGETGPSSAAEELLREALQNGSLRPNIPPGVAREVEARLQRLAPGYAPNGAAEIVDWVEERLVIPADEVPDLAAAVVRDHSVESWAVDDLSTRLVWIRAEATWLLASPNRLPSLRALYPNAAVYGPDPHGWDRPPDTSRFAPLGHELNSRMPEPPSQVEALLEILRFYGPLPAHTGAARFGLTQSDWRSALDAMAELELVVVGELVDDRADAAATATDRSGGVQAIEVCDVETLEYLLRVKRAAARPAFEPVEAAELVPLWSRTTMLSTAHPDADGLAEVLDRLFGFSAPAASWESDLLPARLSDYHPLWLDGLFAEHEILWLGDGSQRLFFCLTDDLRLLGPADTGERSSDLADDPWSAAWAGRASSRSFQAVRRGMETRFGRATAEHPPASRARWHRQMRGGGSAPRSRVPADDWFAVEPAEEPDALARHEDERERARILLRRYGIVFRELVQRESARFAWGPIFRALRLMELAGECVCGAFVRGVPGPQFALRAALDRLGTDRADGEVRWMNAVDPASPCGLGIPGLFAGLPARIQSNHIVYRGSTLVLVSRRAGRELTILTSPDDPDLPALLAPLHNLVRRRFHPLPRVVTETINGLPVRTSEYSAVLRSAGFRDEYTRLVLSAPYR